MLKFDWNMLWTLINLIVFFMGDADFLCDRMVLCTDTREAE